MIIANKYECVSFVKSSLPLFLHFLSSLFFVPLFCLSFTPLISSFIIKIFVSGNTFVCFENHLSKLISFVYESLKGME